MKNTFPFDEASKSLGTKLYKLLSALDEHTKANTQEVRLRSDCRINLRINGELKTLEHLPIITPPMLREAFESICGYSVYAHQQEIAKGYITVRGGHRAGICGTAVTAEGQVTMLRNITSVNLRIARSFRGCSAQLFSHISFDTPCGILITGAPMSGKTTLLRDIAASLSKGQTGRRYAVSVIDERGELAAVHDSTPQYECIRACDVLSGYPKGEAITAAVRSMSPEIIVCDEIGTVSEAQAISEGLNAGVSIIASVHAHSEDELLRRPVISQLLITGAFEYIALLSRNPMNIAKIIKTEDLKNENRSMYSSDPAVCRSGSQPSGKAETKVRIA